MASKCAARVDHNPLQAVLVLLCIGRALGCCGLGSGVAAGSAAADDVDATSASAADRWGRQPECRCVSFLLGRKAVHCVLVHVQLLGKLKPAQRSHPASNTL